MHLDYIFDTLAYPTSWAIPDDSSAMNFLRCLDNFERTVPFAQRAQYPIVFSEKAFLGAFVLSIKTILGKNSTEATP